ncbi:ThiF family adenylyltransferase [Pandoraea sputorum]|uniref:ThiF family adenylyltransferase n=1 Tax=Pandoraea sputorum TaxID=93222 RepID=UPI001E450CF6|nr:ThiF family adenylyltransferase [Pandoraea sputorum]MCE4058736.1 ThiF family adenylyltransferase [Pandoraea sputorum]
MSGAIAISDALAELLDKAPSRGSNGDITYGLALPKLRDGRTISFAELVLPKGFPEHAVARIRLPFDAVLRVPHVEADGLLCIDGDPGPGRGLDATQRVESLVYNFYHQFLHQWDNGDLDFDFAKEPQNYWEVNVSRLRTKDDAARVVWTVDDVPRKARVREGLLLQPMKLVVAADDENPYVQRVIESLGHRAKQRVRVIIADIPISHSFVPTTWPRNLDALLTLLRARLKPPELQRYLKQGLRRRRTREHRIALFRNAEGGFAYLLPGGPPSVREAESPYRGRRSRFRLSIQPLPVDRIDPQWTVGRDQISEVSARTKRHVVVMGAGALGSPVVEQLAKAGVGLISLVDADLMETANIGRHLLGVPYVDRMKVEAVAEAVNKSHPSCVVRAYADTAERWLRSNSLKDVDVVLDLTGEGDVRWHLNEARRNHPCPLVVSWMEPFVAAAHVCILTSETLWFSDNAPTTDRLKSLEAIDWPEDVIRQVPGCSSRFQAYTAANAAYAVALVSENALRVIDGDVASSNVLSWVRGRKFVDKHELRAKFRPWAEDAAEQVGVIKERPFV